MRWLVSAFLLLASTASAQSIAVNGASTGRVFAGIGALSAGGSSRLLKDYPAQQRSDVLDYLFKPNYGAALQILKVEIGGDEATGVGSEAAFERTNGVTNFNSGYEWWLMQQAEARNSGIVFQALAWGAPGWIGGGSYFSTDMQNYEVSFLQGTITNYSLPFMTIGIWNEVGPETQASWMKAFYTAIHAAVSPPLSTQMVLSDECCSAQWNIAPIINGDATLKTDTAALGNHYPGNAQVNDPTNWTTAHSLGIPLYASEDSGTGINRWCNNTWACAQSIANVMNQNYINNAQTQTILWSLCSCYYNLFTLNNAGLMEALTPWSGNYSVDPPIWAVAHTTQFTAIGWTYLNAVGSLTNGGTYVSLKSTNNSDYSMIVESMGASGSSTINITLSGGLSTGTVHVWKSNSSTQFIQQSDIIPSGSTWSATIAADSIYSFTTTTGQAKGSASPPAPAAFPSVYVDTFDSYPVSGTIPALFSDVMGAFDTQPCVTGRTGFCLQQETPANPIAWPSAATIEPVSLIQAPTGNYPISSDFLFAAAGQVKLIGRSAGEQQSNGKIFGYVLYIQNTGAWKLCVDAITSASCGTTLASGSVSAFSLNTWHNAVLTMTGTTIAATIDSVSVASVTDSTYASGAAGIGMGTWTTAQFKNIQLGTSPSQASTPTITGPNSAVTLTCTNAGDTIYYTTNGSSPTTASSVYSAPFSVSLPTTVKALCTAPGVTASNTASNLFGNPPAPKGEMFAGVRP